MHRILLVDDIEFALKLEVMILNSIQKEHNVELKVDTASSVAEALKYLDMEAYDLLVTDMHLDDGFGHQIAEAAIAASEGKTRVVALTAMPNAYAESRELFDTFITKPGDPHDLKKHLLELTRAWF